MWRLLSNSRCKYVKCTTADKFSPAFSSKWFFKGGQDFDRKFTTAERLHFYRFSWRIQKKNWTRAQILTITEMNCYKTYNSAK